MTVTRRDPRTIVLAGALPGRGRRAAAADAAGNARGRGRLARLPVAAHRGRAGHPGRRPGAGRALRRRLDREMARTGSLRRRAVSVEASIPRRNGARRSDLPYIAPRTAHTASRKVPSRETVMNYKVLVVDDSRLARMVMASAFRRLRPDWELVEATGADEALGAIAAELGRHRADRLQHAGHRRPGAGRAHPRTRSRRCRSRSSPPTCRTKLSRARGNLTPPSSLSL